MDFKELKFLNQLYLLRESDKNAKKTLFDAEEIMEDKLKDNPGAVNEEKRMKLAIKMVNEKTFNCT